MRFSTAEWCFLFVYIVILSLSDPTENPKQGVAETTHKNLQLKRPVPLRIPSALHVVRKAHPLPVHARLLISAICTNVENGGDRTTLGGAEPCFEGHAGARETIACRRKDRSTALSHRDWVSEGTEGIKADDGVRR